MTLPAAEIVTRIAIAFVLGALAGVERQWHHKNAGIRTHTLVAIGSAAFTLVSSLGLGPTNNPMIIAAGVVTGIGFIGGGVIMHQGATVQGINTAATLWTTASIGLAAGAGYYTITAIVFLALMLVQFPLQAVERWIDRRSE
jgi:putative Mg2+ transporter-C (MgtC) family protein